MTEGQGLQRRSLLQRILGGSLLAGFAGLAKAAPAAAAEQPPVTAPMLRNVGIAVGDLEKSTKFYTEVFGFKATPAPAKIGAFLSGLMEVENLDMTIQYIETGGPVRIELLSFANPKPTGDGSRHPINTRGLSHWQIRVPDIQAVLDKAPKHGGMVLEKAQLKDKSGAFIAAFVTDPDGTRIELVP